MADRYTLISADCHAGGSHEQYRAYLDPAWLEEFDAWRGAYKNPWKDLRDTDLRVRNWDDERRDADQLADGVVAEVVFPNTVPPFYPGFVLFAPPPTPQEYARRRAGIAAHNRWLVDFCARRPGRRAGIGQIFLNDVDDAIADVTWIHEQGLRGGILLPIVPPDAKWVEPLYHPRYDPLWAHCEELGVVVNVHSGTGSPDYGRAPAVPAIMISEIGFYSQRALVHLLLAGVFERFPNLKFVMTEGSAAALVPLLAQLDGIVAAMRAGAIGELKYGAHQALPRSASEYFRQNCWVGASFPGPADLAAREIMGPDRFMWGSDYPHDEGTHPFTREHLRQVFHAVDHSQRQALLATNAAHLYGFNLQALAPLAADHGPTVAELDTPLDQLPPHPNSALKKGAGQSLF